MARSGRAGASGRETTQRAAELCSCSAVRQAARHLSRLYDEALAPAGVSLNQYSILSKLERFGPQAVAELADRLIMERSTLGHLLRPLQARGLVRIRTVPEDGRRRLVSLDRSGKALLRVARPMWAGAERQFEAAFGARDAAGLRQLMQQVTHVELPAR